MKTERVLALLAATIMACSASLALARGGGSGGGMASQHMSREGQANTNSPSSADPDKGLDRAKERMSEQGLEHEQADKKLKKKKKSNAPHPGANGKGEQD